METRIKADAKKRAEREKTRRRTEQVIKIRLDGAEFWGVRETVRGWEAEAGSDWFLEPGQAPMSDTQIRRYVRAADDLIAASAEKDRARLIDRHLAQRRRLYARAVQAGDLRTALAILRDEAQMLALYPHPEDETRREIERMKAELDAILQGTAGPAAAPAEPGEGEARPVAVSP